ncbi:MAG TPA: error-prone DNA polymerase [Solirubrobacterales bacterium]
MRGSGRGCSYVELHTHSSYSFGDGASLPEELALAAAERGHGAIALTDHDGLWGAMEFAQACTHYGVRPITGMELTAEPEGPVPLGSDPSGDRFHLTLLAASAEGYRNLCRLATRAHAGTRPKPGREPLPPAVALDEVEAHAEGVVCLSGCARDGALAGRWARGETAAAQALGLRLRDAFGRDRFRVELQRPLWRHDRARNRWLEGVAGRLGVPAVATGNVHMHDPRRARLQDALVAVRLGGTLEETEPRRRGNASAWLRPPAETAATLLRDHPEAVAESGRLAEMLEFDLTRDLGYRYPGSEDPGADRALAEICAGRLEHRYAGTPQLDDARRRLAEELRVIRSLGLSGFFLLHYDLLELAREIAAEVRGPDSARMLLPPGRGRGSSVSSVVCYLTGLSHIDPVRNELFLGRFLNEEITDVPDIDLDFPRDIRERLIPRIHERYGPERSALVAAFPTYRSRSAVRDFGKVLGLPLGEVERVARMVDMYDRRESVGEDMAEAIGSTRAGTQRWRELAELAREAHGQPRHASQHPGGMVLSTRPLTDICPVVPAAMEGRQIAQWDKDSCADAGFLKIDLLGLGMLSAVERAVDEIARTRGEFVDLSRIPMDDPETFRAIRAADTTGVFQIESRAQMQMLTRSLPETLDDITVQVAIVRPGPIQGGAVHPYLDAREKLRADPGYEVPYAHPALEPVLGDTLGAIVFQEQVLQVAMALAGFTAGEAEGLRRAMSRKRSEAAMMSYQDRFLAGAIRNGVEPEVAERVFEQVVGFSGFGFPKAHAAAFGLLAYQSTWLRVHYGPEFLCSLLNEQPMGFYPPDALVHEAQRRGIELRGVDVNASAVDCTTEDGGVRIGLGYVNGVREDEMGTLASERERGGAFADVGDLASRSGASADALERLAWAGACDGLEPGGRRAALWRLGITAGALPSRNNRIAGSGGQTADQLALPLAVPAAPRLRELGEWERLVADYSSTGMTLGEHPMGILRPSLDRTVATSADLRRIKDRAEIRVAGLVVARQRPATAKGILFMLLEDEHGTINLIVPPQVYAKHRMVARTGPLLLAHGRLERRGANINLVVARLERLHRPDLPPAEVRQIEPSVGRETGRETGAEAGDLEAALPAVHSFGRRG